MFILINFLKPHQIFNFILLMTTPTLSHYEDKINEPKAWKNIIGGSEMIIFTNRQTDRRTDGQTEKRTHLKILIYCYSGRYVLSLISHYLIVLLIHI